MPSCFIVVQNLSVVHYKMRHLNTWEKKFHYAKLNTQKPNEAEGIFFSNHVSVLLCSSQVTAVPTYPTTRTKTPSASWFASSPRRKVCAEPPWCHLWVRGQWVSCGFRGKHSASPTLSPSQMINARKGIVLNTGGREKKKTWHRFLFCV